MKSSKKPKPRRRRKKATGTTATKVKKEHDIRKRNLDQPHERMDEAIGERKHRLAYAAMIKDTSTQWDIIAAGVEEGVINFFELEGKEATKMKGRSKVTFNKKSK